MPALYPAQESSANFGIVAVLLQGKGDFSPSYGDSHSVGGSDVNTVVQKITGMKIKV